MTQKELQAAIATHGVSPVPAGSWNRMKARFQQTAAYETGSHGQIQVGRLFGFLVAVERVDEKMRAVRRFDDAARASEFVKKRLAQYDRFWDG